MLAVCHLISKLCWYFIYSHSSPSVEFFTCSEGLAAHPGKDFPSPARTHRLQAFPIMGISLFSSFSSATFSCPSFAWWSSGSPLYKVCMKPLLVFTEESSAVGQYIPVLCSLSPFPWAFTSVRVQLLQEWPQSPQFWRGAPRIPHSCDLDSCIFWSLIWVSASDVSGSFGGSALQLITTAIAVSCHHLCKLLPWPPKNFFATLEHLSLKVLGSECSDIFPDLDISSFSIHWKVICSLWMVFLED